PCAHLSGRAASADSIRSRLNSCSRVGGHRSPEIAEARICRHSWRAYARAGFTPGLRGAFVPPDPAPAGRLIREIDVVGLHGQRDRLGGSEASRIARRFEEIPRPLVEAWFPS